MLQTVILAAAFVACAANAEPQAPVKGSGPPPAGGGLDLTGLLGKAGSPINSDPNLDWPTRFCLNHPPDGPPNAIEEQFGSPNGPGPDEKCIKDISGGSGPYKSNMTTESSLPDRTIYAPMQPPPATEKLPLVVWGNGFCLMDGMMFFNYLNEIASHGFVVIANGSPKGGKGGKSTYKEGLKSIDWAFKNPDLLKKYGNVDLSQVIAAGQSCGGGEAYQMSLNDERVKMTMLMNSGVFNGSNTMLAKIRTPVAYFLGGPKDMAQARGDNDYNALPSNIPALKASIDVGHMGTYYQKHGGKIGRASTAFLKWQFKDDKVSKALLCNPGPDSEFIKVGWKIESKNGMC